MNQLGLLLTSCNATTSQPSFIPTELFNELLDQLFPGCGVRCHFVKESTSHTTEQLITYSGYFPSTIHTFLSSFQESGILGMFYKFYSYTDTLQIRFRAEKKRYAEERAEVLLE